MEGALRPLGLQDPGDFTEEAIAGLREASGAGVDPLLLAYHPIARLNPFHSLLYQRAWEFGISPVPILREDTFPELTELARIGFSTCLHLHWLNLVLMDARSAKEAQKFRLEFLRQLDRYHDAGGRIAWTIHNILPHKVRFEEEEARLSADVVERCDVIHVMAEATPEIVAPWFRIPPERMLQVPHPSYLGAYEDSMSRGQARHELGIGPDEFVHVVLGAIRPYKGLGTLLDAWEALTPDGRPRRLVIAGGPTDEEGIDQLLARAAVEPTVLLHAGPVAPSDVQIYLRAADAAALPYERALNSGALLLALSFGLPATVPAGGGLAEVVDDRFSRTFEIDELDGLVGALRAVEELSPADARAAALEVAGARAPATISRQFAAGLRERLSPTTSAAAGGVLAAR